MLATYFALTELFRKEGASSNVTLLFKNHAPVLGLWWMCYLLALLF